MSLLDALRQEAEKHARHATKAAAAHSMTVYAEARAREGAYLHAIELVVEHMGVPS